jgi:hypothetical protein
MLNNKIYNTEHNRDVYTNYVTSCINSGTLESIMSLEEFLSSLYKQDLDDYYDMLYKTYVVNKQSYYEQT